jgi:EAL domain-containing protein (putative c-di-GMP-specific phosphodiesterase class I)
VERGAEPGDFIPMTENAGLIAPLTRYLIESAIRTDALEAVSGIEMTVAVNVRFREASWPEPKIFTL